MCVVMAAATSEYLYVNTMRNVKLSTSIFVHKSSSMLQCGSLSIFFSHVCKHVSGALFVLVALQLEIRRHFVRCTCTHKLCCCHTPSTINLGNNNFICTASQIDDNFVIFACLFLCSVSLDRSHFVSVRPTSKYSLYAL